MNPPVRVRRHRVLAGLAAIALLVSCRGATVSAELDRPFELRIRGHAAIPAAALELGFERVVTDSRCPVGVTCVWAGEAITELWLRRAGATRAEVFQARLGGAGGADTSAWVPVLEYRIRLDALHPYPRAGVTPDSTAYLARLTVIRR